MGNAFSMLLLVHLKIGILFLPTTFFSFFFYCRLGWQASWSSVKYVRSGDHFSLTDNLHWSFCRDNLRAAAMMIFVHSCSIAIPTHLLPVHWSQHLQLHLGWPYYHSLLLCAQFTGSVRSSDLSSLYTWKMVSVDTGTSPRPAVPQRLL
jgi:hypothetical protein